jgi:hypothetical protein
MDLEQAMNDAQFALFMKQIAGTEADGSLPDAEAIWWRAQLRQRLALEERVTRPLRFAEQLACMVCLASAVVLSVVTWGKL